MKNRTMWIALAFATVGLVAGCAGTPSVPEDYRLYGGDVAGASDVVPVAAVFANPDMYADKEIRVSGEIDEVCSKMGCWLTVRSGNDVMRARFVESGSCANGFFVPLDAAGHQIILSGTVRREEISQETARHYLEDAGAPQSEIEKIVGPQQALAMVCTSVAIEDGYLLSEPPVPGQSE